MYLPRSASSPLSFEKSERAREREREMGLAQVFDLKPYAMRSLKGLITERGDEMTEELERDLKGEKDKIEMFKRELPLTVQILSDVMDGFREEMERRKAEKLREFMPAEKGLEEVSGGETQKDNKLLDNKIHWMSSVQLWVDPSPSTSQQREEKERKRPVEALFPPFLKKEKLQQQEEQRVDKLSIGLPEFALVPHVPTGHVAAYNRVEMESPVGGVSQRKSRRCWSPELHRQFVVSLNKLGGAQVATPKQIRDLMKVDGLTNDEVKSHLQKYRLHNRRAPSGNRTQRMGLMGALLGTSSENGASSNPSISHSVSPKDPHQFSNGTISTTEEEDGRSESYNWK